MKDSRLKLIFSYSTSARPTRQAERRKKSMRYAVIIEPYRTILLSLWFWSFASAFLVFFVKLRTLAYLCYNITQRINYSTFVKYPRDMRLSSIHDVNRFPPFLAERRLSTGKSILILIESFIRQQEQRHYYYGNLYKLCMYLYTV